MINWRERELGKKERGLREYRPNMVEFRKICSYRFYRLRRPCLTDLQSGTRDLKNELKLLAQHLRTTFDGSDPIEVLRFLRRYTSTCYRIRYAEDQAFLALPFFLRDPAKRDFDSACATGTSTSVGIQDWPSAVHWMLQNYATNSEIQRAVTAFSQVKQGENEDDLEFYNRFHEAHARCGEYMAPEQLMSVYVEAVDPRLRPVLREARERDSRLAMFELHRIARNHGEILPRRKKDRVKEVPSSLRDRRQRGRNVNFLFPDMHEEGLDGWPTFSVNVLEPADNDTEPLISDRTSDLPTDTPSMADPSEEAESLQAQNDAVVLALNTRYPVRRAPAPYPGNPGYPQPPGEPRRYGMAGPAQARRTPLQSLICYLCYDKGHLATQCRCRDPKVIADNFMALTFQEKTTVPWRSYLAVTGKLNQGTRRLSATYQG